MRELVKKCEDETTREVKEILHFELEPNTERSENMRMDEAMLSMLDRCRKKYGEMSNYQIVSMLLEKELKTPELVRARSSAAKVSRSVPKSVKVKVYKGECSNCRSKRHLEYDHIKEFSLGG